MSGGKPTYGREFFDAVRGGARESAKVVVPLVLEMTGARSVVDVGCGDGTWLAAFAERGAGEIVGVDGAYVDRGRLAVPQEAFVERDLSLPLDLHRRFDLAVSLEVAEHLDEPHADAFVATLTALAPVVLFSAAVPHQTGHHHVNEQWPEYWAVRFAARGYAVADALRPRIWDDPRVTWWYAQNALVYVDRQELPRHPELLAAAGRTDPAALTRIHPRNYARIGVLLEEKARRRSRPARRLARALSALIPRGTPRRSREP